MLRDRIVDFVPKSPDEELNPRFVEACHELRGKKAVIGELRSKQILSEEPETR